MGLIDFHRTPALLLLLPSCSMSSTYVHYQGPSSLPSDYAIVSRLNAQHGRDNDETETTSGSDTPTIIARRYSGARRPRLTIGTNPSKKQATDASSSPPSSGTHYSPSERTPLLSNPPVPRIPEPDSENKTPREMMWEELRILSKYALPVFGTHVMEYSLVIVSVITIGHISTTALAAISLGSMTASVSGFSIIQGLASALDTMLPSAWTSTQPQQVGLWAQRMTVVMLASLIPMFAIWFNAESLLVSLKQDPEVAHLASVYLRWVSLGLPAYGFNCISRRYFQSQGLFAVPTRIVTIVAPLNALLNYTLVWGPSYIRLGFIGAPIATAISFNFISLLSVIYGVLYTPRTAWMPLSRRMFEPTGLIMLAKLGFSGVGQTASEWWAWELVALAASLLGPTALATQSVLLVSSSTTFQAPFALSVATAVRIGNLLGERKARRAGVAADTAIAMAFVISCIPSAMFLIFRHSWAYIFNDDPEVVTLVSSCMILLALFQVFDGMSAVTGGILRARGMQFVGAVLNLSSYYIFGIPIGLFLAFRRNLGVQGLWLGLTFSLVYSALIGSWICLRTDWALEAQKVARRVEKEDKICEAREEVERREVV